MLQKLQMAGLGVLCAAVVYMIYRLSMNDWATDRLDAYWDFFVKRTATRGYILSRLPANSSDAAPCEICFAIESDTVRIHGASWDIYRLVKKLDVGKITKEQLEAKSRWPSEKLPL